MRTPPGVDGRGELGVVGLQQAIGSVSHAEGRIEQSQTQAPTVDGTFWTIELPRHWVVEVQGRLWAVPAVCGGWSTREPYSGPREQLRPYSRRTARIILRLLSQ